ATSTETEVDTGAAGGMTFTCSVVWSCSLFKRTVTPMSSVVSASTASTTRTRGEPDTMTITSKTTLKRIQSTEVSLRLFGWGQDYRLLSGTIRGNVKPTRQAIDLGLPLRRVGRQPHRVVRLVYVFLLRRLFRRVVLP